MDGNTWFGYRIQYGEPRIPRLPRRKRPNSTTCQSAGPATCRSAADGQSDHWKLASKAPQNLDAELKVIIVVEVERVSTTMPSPTRSDGSDQSIMLGWSTRPGDAGPARSMEGTAYHGSDRQFRSSVGPASRANVR